MSSNNHNKKIKLSDNNDVNEWMEKMKKSTCWGCREDQPNQAAHMDEGGCLYIEEKIEKKVDK